MAEKVKLRIGSVANAVLVTGQAYQDPNDALNEFVSNAADEYVERGEAGRIRIVLKRRGRYPTIAVDDDGRGMSADRLREVARNLFKSVKVGNERTLGEKAIGLLAFQQLGRRMDIVSRAEGSTETWCLALERGSATARLEPERRRARPSPGTTVFLREVDREVLRMLTQRKIVDYLRRRRGEALERGMYEIEVVEGRSAELVSPDEPDGVKVPLRTQHTLWGPIELSLYVAPPDGARRQVAVVGRAGTTIIDDLTELEELAVAPWSSGQVSGRIAFAALAQSAGPARDRPRRWCVPRVRRRSPVGRPGGAGDGRPAASGRRPRDERPGVRRDPPGIRVGAARARRPRQPDAHTRRRRFGTGCRVR